MADDVDAADRLSGTGQSAGVSVRGIRLAVLCALAAVVALGTVGGLLASSALRAERAAHQRAEFLSAGRQGALNLTSIDYTDAEGAVRRILDSSVGAFHDDFQKRSGPFIDVVKRTQSTTRGTIAETAIESARRDQALVLVAVSVQTTSPTQPTPDTHLWRMRITVQTVGDGAKMSDVAFVS